MLQVQFIVSPEDEDLARRWAWKAHKPGGSYFKAKIGGRMQYLHRIIAGAEKGQIVDHIDGDPRNNRRENLRVVDSHGSNCNRNRRSDSRAPYKGITQTPSGKWVAQIMCRKVYHRIGLFDSAEMAARAYDQAAIALHGKCAKTNGLINEFDASRGSFGAFTASCDKA